MDIPNILDFLFQGSGILIFKIPILALLFLYIIFLFVVINRIRALNRTVHIIAANASNNLQIFAVVQFFLAVSLFLLAIVIV